MANPKNTPKPKKKETTFVNDKKRDKGADLIKGMPSGIYKPMPKGPGAKKDVPVAKAAPKPKSKGKPGKIGNFTTRDGRGGAISAMKKSVRNPNKRNIGTRKAFSGSRPNR